MSRSPDENGHKAFLLKAIAEPKTIRRLDRVRSTLTMIVVEG